MRHRSFAISQAAWSPADEVSADQLFVAFLDGNVYSYDGVDQQTAADFLNAPSLGSFFNQNIRDAFSAASATGIPSTAFDPRADIVQIPTPTIIDFTTEGT